MQVQRLDAYYSGFSLPVADLAATSKRLETALPTDNPKNKSDISLYKAERSYAIVGFMPANLSQPPMT